MKTRGPWKRPRGEASYKAKLLKHICQRCPQKLRADYKPTICVACRKIMHIKRYSGVKTEAGKRLAAGLAFIEKTYHTHSPALQATELGVSLNTIKWMRWEARKRGYNVGHAAKRATKEWDRLDRLMMEACGKCGLRGSHTCLAGNAFDARGPGRVYPDCQ